ncbi:hypothetical protein Caci_3865 [Catenulispora acidiphila DSM 44928]|uniref:Uncharacterized protein n=1 Tax=Catenulispora acidiphila (strain DSM 44928 / JCM 14897 / NBRC 102108 / NRRL B-24433 / ID139908) TaxID=479433 RepID=C7QDG6_CATAD|nr:hypothetical protein [Catenulispora acidiphila]ACU72759.1 hypothetical protein Caci_3865 [Catenulispora acidiphila DSM 44928]
MSNEENRSPGSLLLLCIPHDSEIDDTPDDFPEPMLRQWKQAQRDEHQRLRQGWNMTDEQAAEVARTSFTPEDVADAIADRLPFSPRQRPKPRRLILSTAACTPRVSSASKPWRPIGLSRCRDG